MFKRTALRLFHYLALPFMALWRRIRKIAAALTHLWHSLGPRWFRALLILAVLVAGGLHLGKQLVKPNLTRETVYKVRYLDQGWSERDRERYYYTPQGTELLGMDYDWLANLEMPMSEERLADDRNMRGWGFIVTPGQQPNPANPGNLPVGLGRHVDPKSGAEHLDIGCAACHTGELHYQGTALRIDGGQAVQSIPTAKRGEFITTLGVAMLETAINPLKWNRFADRVAGHDEQKREQLRKDVWAFLGKLKDFSFGPGASKYYPTEEGRGRTDAVGRIANVVFGYDLDEPDNYRVADAPVSYPFLWDIWRFDWVQYTGFTNQPIARNVGESLGVLAPIKLVDKQGHLLDGEDFGETVVNIKGMHCVESVLRKLKPPKWPEDLLGKIDIAGATRGKNLFQDKCVACHGPHISKPYRWQVATGPNDNPDNQASVNWQWEMEGDISYSDGKAYRDDWRESIWSMPWIATDVIGTDSTAADNFMDHTYNATKLVPGSQPVNAGDGLEVLLDKLVPILYRNWDITGEEVPDYDGLNVPFRIANKRAYKARPLHGVWATPPFLHNGSVPTIHDLLSPLEARPTRFAVGNREYDPIRLGYTTEAGPGSFIHDTTQTGNANTGHLFTDADMPGRIGKLLSERERMDLIEYIKVMGNPEFSDALGGDPLNWDRYSNPPSEGDLERSCQVAVLTQEAGK